jgi:hypothetical protein
VALIPQSLDENATYVNDGCAVELHSGQRLYVADRCGAQRVGKEIYTGMQLLGKTLRYTTDVSGADCGCNVAIYLADMRAADYPQCKDNYCDANPQITGCGTCAEVDIQEANLHAFHTTLHSPGDTAGVGAGYGGEGAQIAWGHGLYGPGGRCVDTRKPFEVAAYFSPAGISVLLSQKGSPCSLPLSVGGYAGLPIIARKLADGTMALVMSYWQAKNMTWLDGPGQNGSTACQAETCNCGGPARFYGFSLDGQTATGNGWHFEIPHVEGRSRIREYGADRACVSTGDVKGIQRLLEDEHQQKTKDAAKIREERHRANLQKTLATACGTGRLEEVAHAVREARAGGLREDLLKDAVAVWNRLRRARPRYLLEFILYNLDYLSVAADRALRGRFEVAVKSALASETAGTVNPDCVTLGLLPVPGSVSGAAQIRVDVSPDSSDEPGALLEKLRGAAREGLGESIAAHVQQVAGIQRATRGSVRARRLGGPRVLGLEEEGDGAAARPVALILGAVLATMLVGAGAVGGWWASSARKVKLDGYIHPVSTVAAPEVKRS